MDELQRRKRGEVRWMRCAARCREGAGTRRDAGRDQQVTWSRDQTSQMIGPCRLLFPLRARSPENVGWEKAGGTPIAYRPWVSGT